MGVLSSNRSLKTLEFEKKKINHREELHLITKKRNIAIILLASNVTVVKMNNEEQKLT